ncbi:alpha/beta hydrolase [Litorimonas sp. RW-G-Af-16]|uniref:alpha/beta hydrolase n=1 Tax=Litorimonas sp. RW-G-Af-16 TaxID=3241168 RepID=UPI00390C6909
MSKLIKILMAVAAIYAVVAIFVFTQQRSFLYFPPNTYLPPEAVGVPEMEEIPISAGSMSWATAWWAPPTSPTGKIVMVFHGNGSAVFSNYHIYRDLIDAGHGVWGVGYPGYPGPSPERSAISQQSIVLAASLQYEAVQDRNDANAEIVYYGTSLGTGVAAQLARQHPPSLLIMDAPFNSTLDMGRRQMPFLPVGLLMKDTFESDKALADLEMPMIWLHGTNDGVIPVSQGQKLYDGYRGPKTAHIIEGGQHMNLWTLGGREITLAALSEETPPP